MPVVSEILDESTGRKTLKFGPTPVMYGHPLSPALYTFA
jgi:hypothetical protein